MKRAVRTLIRLVAAGFVLFGSLTFGLEFMRDRMKHAGISVWHCVLGGILVVIGVVLFWTSARLAERLGEDFDE